MLKKKVNFVALKIDTHEKDDSDIGCACSVAELERTDCENVAIIIGSEGGFSQREADMMVEKGAVNIVLGARILRCETAAVTAASLVMFSLGQLE
jgi:RsmE family RNA methyltransferase